jgi:hypothetical protein
MFDFDGHRKGIETALEEALEVDTHGEWSYTYGNDEDGTISFVHPDSGGLQVQIDDEDFNRFCETEPAREEEPPRRYRVRVVLEPVE